MRRLISIPLVLLLAAAVHVDWHMARSHHHRLSLEWRHHWVFAALCFAAAAWYVARRWPGERWRAGAYNVALALVAAQVIEPLLEVAFYDHRFGVDIGPDRWRVFAECVAAGLPAFACVLYAARPRAGAAEAA